MECLGIMDPDLFFPIIPHLRPGLPEECQYNNLERGGTVLVGERERGKEEGRETEGCKRNRPLGKGLSTLFLNVLPVVY